MTEHATANGGLFGHYSLDRTGMTLPSVYDDSSPLSILEFGRRMKGLTARELCHLSGHSLPTVRVRPASMKGLMGDVAEWYFGLPRNNSPEPDFPRAKVELKVVPLKRTGDGLRVKEPTSIGLINYMTLIDERWEPRTGELHSRASVRKKLDSVLFVFYEHCLESPLDSRVRDVVLWHPGKVEDAVFGIDWERTWKKVWEGEAHLLSERIAEVLAPRRKGRGHEQLRPQPHNEIRAPPRAFALKVRFTNQILEEEVLGREFESVVSPDLLAQISSSGVLAAERRCVGALSQFEGRTLADISRRAGLPVSNAKNLASTIIKDALNVRNRRARMRELEQWGFDVKTIGVRRSDGMPFESVSFPTYDLELLALERWEDSELADQLRHLLFVPTFAENRHVPQQLRVLGRAFAWTPNEAQERTIRGEWEMFRKQVMRGGAVYRTLPNGRRSDRLSHQASTSIIHVRPHGKNRLDRYRDPLGNLVTKRCFWLNARFVQSLVLEHAWPPPR